MASPAAPVVDRPIMVKLRELINANPENGIGWDNAWKQDVTPWDTGDIQPALRDLINSQVLDLPRTGRALVPGCGKGYDAVFIASALGLDTLGIDISPVGIENANEHLASTPVAPPGKVALKVMDFFAMTAADTERYDVIYEFFVAIHPALRDDWGRQMNTLIKPGGYLIALVYPLDPETDTGPPFYVRLEHYVKVLGECWEKVFDAVPAVSIPSHVGRERLIVWRKK